MKSKQIQPGCFNSSLLPPLAIVFLFAVSCASGGSKGELKPASFSEYTDYNKLLAAAQPDLKGSKSPGTAGRSGGAENKISPAELAGEVKTTGGASGGPAAAELQAAQKAAQAAEKNKRPIAKTRATGRAFANFRGTVMESAGGGVSVKVTRIALLDGRGGQFALALEAFNVANRRLVARSNFLRINSGFRKGFARGVSTFTLPAGKLRNAPSDLTFSLVSYFSANKRTGWRMTNFVPVGRASLSGGNARIQAYYTSLLTGHNFTWKNIGGGAGHVKSLTFLYNSTKGCMEFKESVTAVGFGMQIANNTSGCVAIQGNRMVFHGTKFCGPRCGRINSRKQYGFRLFGNGIRRVQGRTSRFFRKDRLTPAR